MDESGNMPDLEPNQDEDVKMEPKEEDFDADTFIYGEPTGKEVSRLEKDQLVKCLCELEYDTTRLSGNENKLQLIKAVKELMRKAELLSLTDQERQQLDKEKEREEKQAQREHEMKQLEEKQRERELVKEQLELARAKEEREKAFEERRLEHEKEMLVMKLVIEW